MEGRLCMENNLKLIVFDNAIELGKKVNFSLQKMRGTNENFIIPITATRFSNGEGKVKIDETVRGKDLYILSDVGNYNISYDFHGMKHYMSPDEHFQDIKRVISAMSGHAHKINVIMPLLYQSRQHKRKGRESLDCALALQELERIGVSNIITFDAHDPNVANAVPCLSLDNFYPTNIILDKLIEENSVDNILVISPDMGAMERARYYAEILGCDVGLFYKRRDLSRVVNGKNPILDHTYLGRKADGMDVIVVDDMIASGGSMLECTEMLKKQGARKVYLASTFALFTDGVEKFDTYYKEGLFDKLYTTNLSYIPEEIQNKEWFSSADLSVMMANIIDRLNNNKSIESIHNGKSKIYKKVLEKKTEKE